MPGASAPVDDAAVLQVIDTSMRLAAERAGEHLACYRGCAVCCFGPFPITANDAARLKRGLETLAQSDEGTAAALRRRAEGAIAVLQSKAFPGDARSGSLEDDIDEAAFAAMHGNLACPALDAKSGACLLYEYRPIACRTYGPPLRLNGEALPACPMCFKRANTEEIETARVVLEIPEEQDDKPRTLIAFALAR